MIRKNPPKVKAEGGFLASGRTSSCEEAIPLMEKTIRSYEDLMNMLDRKFRSPEQFWNPFYSNRESPVPFFKNAPDENLVSYYERGLIQPGKLRLPASSVAAS